jgi:hypothetical protein
MGSNKQSPPHRYIRLAIVVGPRRGVIHIPSLLYGGRQTRPYVLQPTGGGSDPLGASLSGCETHSQSTTG